MTMISRIVFLTTVLAASALVVFCAAPSAGTLPSIPSAGRVLWLKADSVIKADDNAVTRWRDAGGNGRQAVFSTVNGQGVAPILVENAVNDRPAVRFAGNSLLSVPSLPLGEFTIAVVFTTTTQGEMLFQHGNGTDGCSLRTGATSTLSVTRGGVRTVLDSTGEAGDAWASEMGIPVVVIVSFDGTDDGLQLTVNGSRQLLAPTTAGALNDKKKTTQSFHIGARTPDGDQPFHGELAELVIYDHILPKTAYKLLNSTLMKKYVPPRYFTNPTGVNLLEQWYRDGSYALTATASAGDPTNAVVYPGGGNGWVIGNASDQPDNTITARFTFPQPVVLGQVLVQWRVESHSPSNYTFRDQHGVIVTDTDGPYNDQPRVHAFEARSSQYLEFSCSPAATEIGVFEVDRLGAFLAAGQSLPMTGATNILYEERGIMQVTGSGYDPCWYDQTATMMKPAGEGGELTLHLSREYELLGAFITHYDTTRFLANMRIEISKNGTLWSTVYADEQYHFRGEAPPRDRGYITWDVPADSDLYARWVRLSWGANAEPVELSEWQLFGR